MFLQPSCLFRPPPRSRDRTSNLHMKIQLRVQKPCHRHCSKPPLSVSGKQAPGSGLAGELPFLAGRAEGLCAAESSPARILPAPQVPSRGIHSIAVFCRPVFCVGGILSLNRVVSQQHAERLCNKNTQPGKQEGSKGPAGLYAQSISRVLLSRGEPDLSVRAGPQVSRPLLPSAGGSIVPRGRFPRSARASAEADRRPLPPTVCRRLWS